jgi:hypothetical protein
MNVVEKIKKTYEFFSRIVISDESFKFKQDYTEYLTLESFVKRINKDYSSYGNTFLFNYFCFQFSYWNSKNFTKSKLPKLPNLTWIIGKKAYDRWNNKNENWKFFIDRDFLSKNKKITRNRLIIALLEDKVEINVEVINILENQNKKKYYNTPMGLAYCLETTTLFNEKSNLCLECNSKNACKALLDNLTNKNVC